MSEDDTSGRKKDPYWYYYYIPFKMGQANLGVLIPLFILNLGGSAKEIGISSMLFSLVTIIATIIWGRFSDETGKRKPYIVMGFLGLSICFLLLNFSNNDLQVIAIYALLAFFMAAELPITPIYLLRNVSKGRWDDAFSRFNALCSWALTTGLVLGGVMMMFVDIEQTAMVLFLISLLSVILAKFRMSDMPMPLKRSKMGVFPSQIVERKRFMPNFVLHFPRLPKTTNNNNRNFFYAIALLFMGSNFVFLPIIPYLRQIGVGDSLIFLSCICNYIASSVIYLVISRDMKAMGCLKVLKRGLAIRAFIVLGMLFGLVFISEHAFAVVIIFYTLLGVSWPHIYSSAVTFVSEASNGNNSGGLMGKYNAVSTFGLMVGSLFSGYVFDIFSVKYCLSISLVFYTVAYLVLFKYVKKPECAIDKQ
ncbi:MAG: MFS transporter [Candidatus Methanofastidiosa archaeon]|nr:MFS transporter [Candidatus Methanofastidiosa archaeon]